MEQVQIIAPGLNLNEQPLVVQQDINAAPVVEDPEEMIIHPPQLGDLQQQQLQNANWDQHVERGRLLSLSLNFKSSAVAKPRNNSESSGPSSSGAKPGQH